jgi:hypothetical protein
MQALMQQQVVQKRVNESLERFKSSIKGIIRKEEHESIKKCSKILKP